MEGSWKVRPGGSGTVIHRVRNWASRANASSCHKHARTLAPMLNVPNRHFFDTHRAGGSWCAQQSRGRKDHTTMIILQSGPKAQRQRDSRSHGL